MIIVPDSQVHVMDASDNRSSSITVDPFPVPSCGFWDWYNIRNTTLGTVSMIDNDANQTRYGIRYHINSNTSGSIFCNGKELSDNYYTTYLTNELVTCNVNSTNSFSPILSTSWKLDDHDTYRQTIGSPYLLSFNVTGHGDLNVSIEDIPSLIQRWGSIMSLVTVILVIVLAAIPSMKFHGKTNTRQEGKQRT